ncbi:MAG: hypothetical protein H0X40_04505 [Chthoniobacterales bacterium]|nr:hypothetical protein [Chthoniobacterales bacterium]
MPDLELLNLARSATEHQVAWFAQMLSVNFAMVVAIYYFLHRATIALRLFTFFAYTVGMLVLLGQMLGESNVKFGVLEALRALPVTQLSRPSVYYLAFSDSSVALVTRVTFNLSVWLLWIGVSYLLFFSQRHWTSNKAMQRTADRPNA